MGKTINHGNWKKEKGFTLVEMIVSLAIISIISVAAVSLAVYSVNSLSIARIKNFFSHETYNFASMYLTYSESDFISNVNQLTNNSETLTYHNFTIYYDNENKYVGIDNKVNSLNFTFDVINHSLTLTALDSNANEIMSRSVSK